MFTTFKYRRHIAVLAVLAMVASVMVAAPAVAADPKADYTATFDACVGVGSSDFTDVPAGHANAGDIDCIAYYGITKGTSATTYSPTMSVTREHMALFLTRLAGLVGIEMASDPDDAGFTDIGDLSAESQTAINQLADLGITQGTSATAYSPSDSVTRGQMALFISRLMEEMTPMMAGNIPYGFVPSKVVAVDDEVDDTKDKVVGSPYTDLGSVTKNTYDAITNLYELGVASGISDTAYGPSALITRASMAAFMAGVLDHSNARPAGISIQAQKTWDFDAFTTTVAVSYRGDDFMPMVDASIKVFNLDDISMSKLTENGTCPTPAECEWSDAEDLTDEYGNSFLDGDVNDGKKNTYYAWMGAKNGEKFDADTSKHAMVTLSSTMDATKLKVTSDISTNSEGDNTVDLDVDNSVTFTVQLTDDSGAKVAKSGVKVMVALELDDTEDGSSPESVNPGAGSLTTDAMGMATFTVTGPKSTKGDDDERYDKVTFTSDVDGSGLPVGDAATGETVVKNIVWTDADPTTAEADGASAVAKVPEYVILNDGKANIRATVNVYDQYGNAVLKGKSVNITIGSSGAAPAGTASRRVITSRGMASHRATVTPDVAATTEIGITYGEIEEQTGTDGNGNPTYGAVSGAPSIPTTGPGSAPTVVIVERATDDSTHENRVITGAFLKDNRFHYDRSLYTYDSDDTFLDGGNTITLAEFEVKLGANIETIGTQASVQVVLYDDDGASIFIVTSPATE